MKKLTAVLLVSVVILGWSRLSLAEGKNVLIHVKTQLKIDDAQICVAYNEIWAALNKGFDVDVLIDASAVNTYKKGWKGTDKLEGYKMPESLRAELARQFAVSLHTVPKTYGEYLTFLHKEGAQFYINGAMLVVSGISETFGDMSKISPDMFKPVSLIDMFELFEQADTYIVY